MRIKINEEENNICKEYILKYLNELSLDDAKDYITNNYPKFIVNNMNLFEIANEFYIDEDIYEDFKSNLSYDYTINNIDKLVYINIDDNMTYAPKINSNDLTLDSFVKNGTLVIKMNRLLDFGLDIKYRAKSTKSINEYIKLLESKISNKIGIDTRILINDIAVLNKK